jgi:hypothetical protein
MAQAHQERTHQSSFKPSGINPCLFTKEKTILVLNVDDAVLFSPGKSEIDNIVEALKADINLTDDWKKRYIFVFHWKKRYFFWPWF